MRSKDVTLCQETRTVITYYRKLAGCLHRHFSARYTSSGLFPNDEALSRVSPNRLERGHLSGIYLDLIAQVTDFALLALSLP